MVASSADGDHLIFDFSRLNLPKCIEFHGQVTCRYTPAAAHACTVTTQPVHTCVHTWQPDFPPEEDATYEGKQFLALHALAPRTPSAQTVSPPRTPCAHRHALAPFSIHAF